MPSYQNIVESPNPGLWTAFTTTLSSNTTPPIPGTGSSIISSYMQNGKILFINLTFTNAAVGTDGSGVYRFNLPSGFSINTAVAIPFDGTNYTGHLGSAFIDWPSTPIAVLAYGVGVTYDSTHYYLVLMDQNENINPYGSSWYGVQEVFYITANLIIPIN